MTSLEVKPSRIDGKGVFARDMLPARTKVGELSGTVITLKEARRRARKLRRIAIVEFEDDMALDASADRCLRYVNHSCAPNTYLRRIGHRVEFYTLRTIERGEELTCDYGDTHHDGKLPCRCGSEACRTKI
ncbi:MAG: SET domain-containing protein [Acidobacteriota bacterium]|nr:SET domain-containing protein [Acidobacteriota bacterium]